MYVKFLFLFFAVATNALTNDTEEETINNDKYTAFYFSNTNTENCTSECFFRTVRIDSSNCNGNSLKNMSNTYRDVIKNTTFEKNQFNISNAREFVRVQFDYNQEQIESCTFMFLRTNCLHYSGCGGDISLKSDYSNRHGWWENDKDLSSSWVRLAVDITNFILVGFAILLLLILFSQRQRKNKNHPLAQSKQYHHRFEPIQEQLI